MEVEKLEHIRSKLIEEEMKASYIDYAMSVIIGRALPDVRDGLKPVHRRILYAMHEMGLFFNKPFKKSARIVGEVLGKFHPHGDTAVYDALVRMTQDFSLRYPLIQGQGNFGSIDGDNAAAMRYTEAKLAKIASELLIDIKKETVRFVPNFDGSLKEPTVLPSKVPNLLINGSSGIAVGMATNIPPHNLREVNNAIIALIDDPDLEEQKLLDFIKGPDFPTGGIICGKQGIVSAYKTGRGKITIRAKTELEEIGAKQTIIVKEIPYMVNKSSLLEEIANAIRNKKVLGVSDLRDESDKEGLRIVMVLKKDTNPEIVLNQLFKHTKLEITTGINLLALCNGEPKTLTLKQMLLAFIEHRKEIITKRTKFDLASAEKKAHILNGLKIALDDIDKAITTIKASKSIQEAIDALLKIFPLTKEQAQAILDLKLQRLTSLEQNKIREDLRATLKLIEELKSILASEQKIKNLIKKDLIETSDVYGDKRKTQIIEVKESLGVEDLIEHEKTIITSTYQGYIKRQSLDVYKKQKRGGSGIIATGKKEEDFIKEIFIADTHSTLLVFTNKGKVYWLKVYQVPESSRTAFGTPIINLINIGKNEVIQAIIPIENFSEKLYLSIATKNGLIKKTPLIQYAKPRTTGIIAIDLEKDDEVVNAVLTDGSKDIILATKNGLAIRFNEKEVRPVRRAAKGVKGISLKNGDEVIGMVIAADEKTLFTVTSNGYGKRTKISDYRPISRAGVGVINIKCTKRNGHVVAINFISDEDELMLISKNGVAIRIPAKDISVIGRNTQGFRLMKLKGNDHVVASAKIVHD
ncbi:DNA gyrase subunit A [Candidatus Woesearchaeota archaeon]|nr:MAG: DNA gyrase subunit A [Candidatus Woesearchaeota archaeon]